ncbi:molecular chaperone DnaJ [Altererythrobacter sp. Root672]|uniref:molecular chaperone DnaJ n=1 Tax=Altererythrobacter sp. Root672 TaxID=1736584 RepID=UPI0006FBEBEC|nr:molecular chaperone DnaJ [Altererythrobacter sp. Root672]KRA81461.1 molecular chaperone DnaJ [Altererythrobacter sp. Root672]
MMRILFFVALGVLAWRTLTGRWPWERNVSTHAQAVSRARKLLGVATGATREDILTAHRQLAATVHPDRGGSNAQMHEANAARDLLLEELPPRID